MEGKCNDCGVLRPYLHKHHLKPQSEGGTDADGVAYLCSNCHEDRHGGPCGGTLGRRLTHSPAAQEKRSRSMKEAWKDPALQKKQRASRLTAWEQRDNAAVTQMNNERWSDPEKRKEHAEKIRRARQANPNWGKRGENPRTYQFSGRWSSVADACLDCGKTDRKHQGKGLCTRCYQRKRWHEVRS